MFKATLRKARKCNNSFEERMQTLYRGYTIDATHRISKNNIIKCILQKILGIVRPLCFVVGGRNHCHWFHIHMITTLASSGIQIGKTYIARSTFLSNLRCMRSTTRAQWVCCLPACPAWLTNTLQVTISTTINPELWLGVLRRGDAVQHKHITT